VNGFLASIRAWILRFLRVPPEPHPPAGSPGSLRIFRAGESYRRLLILGWAMRHVILVGAFLFWIAASHFIPEEIPVRSKRRGVRTTQVFRTADYRGWITVLETAGLVLAVLQMPFSYVMAMLRFEMRWYMVTDRSLRIREGIGTVKEVTLSFANLQHISVRQNPVQRLFGLYDVEVKSAGGGGGAPGRHQHGGESWHTAVFRHVSNGEEIRDLIIARQRALKAAGLGDPDEPEDRPHAAPAPIRSGNASALDAARELLVEVRATRLALGSPSVNRPQTPG
jgi:hypothetical protein